MSKEIDICQISKYYSKALEALDNVTKLSEIELDKTNISEAIYFHLSKMKYAGWKHRVDFNRSRKHSISDFFQDIIAYYLKAALSNEYTVLLEPKVGKTQPDILIKRNNKNLFIIEVKTNIGWNRPDKTKDNPYDEFEQRVNDLSCNFSIPKCNIIYIFEEHGNVGREFSENFWDKKTNISVKRPRKFPFSIIYPLFNQTDPYYWKENTGIKKNDEYKKITDKEFMKYAKENIVYPFEEILRTIKKAKT